MSNKVLLILADGMRPDSISKCGNDGFQAFFESGNYSYSAMTINPPITLPCHMSLFYSIPAEKHGVFNNTYVPMKSPVKGLFEILSEANKINAVFYSWQELRDLFAAPNTVAFSWMMNIHNYWKQINLDEAATEACEQYLLKYLPDFCFLYLGMVDECGHEFGWMSSEYLNCMKTATECIQHIVSVLPPEYSVFITADHGGHDRYHGDNIAEDMMIPLSCYGPMFQMGKELKGPVSIMDIAPTIVQVLDIAPNPEWEGKSLIAR